MLPEVTLWDNFLMLMWHLALQQFFHKIWFSKQEAFDILNFNGRGGTVHTIFHLRSIFVKNMF